MAETEYAKGLEGVIAAESQICQIDGASGKLYYRGYSIEELAQYSSFEEATYLLLYEQLPNEEQLADFSQSMRKCRDLPESVQQMIGSLSHKNCEDPSAFERANYMKALRQFM